MSESSGITSTSLGSTWTALERDGKTIVVTYMEFRDSYGNARTIEALRCLYGLKNFLSNAEMLERISEQLSTSDEASPIQPSNTPLSHSGCWCNS